MSSPMAVVFFRLLCHVRRIIAVTCRIFSPISNMLEFRSTAAKSRNRKLFFALLRILYVFFYIFVIVIFKFLKRYMHEEGLPSYIAWSRVIFVAAKET